MNVINVKKVQTVNKYSLCSGISVTSTNLKQVMLIASVNMY